MVRVSVERPVRGLVSSSVRLVSAAVSQPTTTSPRIERLRSRVAVVGQVAAEEEAEGGVVGDLEDAVGADEHVDVEGVHVGAEHAVCLAARQHVVEQRRGRRAELAQGLHLRR